MNLASYIDHTLLKAEAKTQDILKICAEARDFGFASVCVNPFFVPLAAASLQGSKVKICSVVGFPLGSTSWEIKLAETQWCLQAGAQEIDMVMNIAAAKSGDWPCVEEEIKKLAHECHQQGALLKVILEMCLLQPEEKLKACQCALSAGADFIKTSTGFSSGGASLEDVRLMRQVVGNQIGVKASGGIKDQATALAMIEAGASRLGTSSGVSLVGNQAAARDSY